MTALRTHCPSCRHRISPLAMECPVCGLTLEKKALPRPLLFQASALHATTSPEPRKVAISSPALGRVVPMELPTPTPNLPLAPPVTESFFSELRKESPVAQNATGDSFWPLVRLEIMEAACLLLLNAILVIIFTWQVKASPEKVYGEFWYFIVPVHFAVSWAFEMVPLTLAGQSPMMGSLGLLLDSSQPERRIAFSLMHLFSVLVFPVSFFCMVLTPSHRTLGEILSGQEILARPLPRIR